MKNFLVILFLTAMCMLVSCGRNVRQDEDVQKKVEITTTGMSVQSSAARMSAVTTVVTTVPKTDPPDSIVLTALDSVEVYDEVDVLKFITDTNTKLKNAGDLLDTSELGEKKVKISFEYDGIPYEKEISYNVVDTTQPVVLNSGWTPYTLVNQPFDLDSMVGFADNYDRSPQLSYTGDVDTSEVGSYPITVTVTDSSGNSTSWEMIVFVTNEIPTPQDNNARVSFADFRSSHDYGNVSYGIDVSAWQRDVDYEAVKSDGCEFVIMRMGYYYDHVVMDDYYQSNMENASAAGLKLGVYFYTTDNTEEGVRKHARWIVEQLGGRQLDFPIAFDWEEWGRFQQYGMSIHDLNQLFEAFCDELEQHGYTGMLYSSKNFLNNFWENRNDRPVWLAHFVDETDYDGRYAIWQGSAYGRIAGIGGDVDMNIRYNDVPLD